MCCSFVLAYLIVLCEFKVFNGKQHCFQMLNWVNGLCKVFDNHSSTEIEESDCKHQDTWVMSVLSSSSSYWARWLCHIERLHLARHHVTAVIFRAVVKEMLCIFSWINQPDAANSQVYYLSFKYSSTCFRHPHAHHQELQQLQ